MEQPRSHVIWSCDSHVMGWLTVQREDGAV